MPKRSSRKMDDQLRAEYDFRALRVVARGPGRKAPHEITVRLAPDVAETFPDSNAVNEALRLLIRMAKGQTNTGKRLTQAGGAACSKARACSSCLRLMPESLDIKILAARSRSI